MTSQYFRARTQCPACKDSAGSVVYERKFLQEPVIRFLELKFRPEVIGHFDGLSYRLTKCKNCGLIYQQQVLTDEGLALLYNKWLFEGDSETIERSEMKDFIRYGQEVLKIRKFFRKPVNDIKVLDYGMGRGKWCSVAHALGYQVVGTDLSDQLLENSRNLGFTVLPLHELGDHRFDFINTEQVFEHLGEPLEVLIKLRDLLADDGIVKISVPDGSDVESKLADMDWTVPRGHRNFLVPVTPAIHINTFSYDSIVGMGRAASMEPVSASLAAEYTILSALSARDLIKSLIKPVYRRYRKSTYAFLRRSGQRVERQTQRHAGRDASTPV
jgi:SAM-dependent methyltransferase